MTIPDWKFVKEVENQAKNVISKVEDILIEHAHPCCFQVGMYVCSFKHGNAIYIYTYIVLFFSFNRMLTSYPSGRVCNTGRRRWFRQLYDHGRITSLPRHWNAPEIGNGIMIWKLKGHMFRLCKNIISYLKVHLKFVKYIIIVITYIFFLQGIDKVKLL